MISLRHVLAGLSHHCIPTTWSCLLKRLVLLNIMQSERALSLWKLNSHRLPLEVMHMNTEHEPSFISIKKSRHHICSREPRKSQYVSVCDWSSIGIGGRSSASPDPTGTGCCWERKPLPRAPVLGWGQAHCLQVRSGRLRASPLHPLKGSATSTDEPCRFLQLCKMAKRFLSNLQICYLSQSPKAVPGNCFEIYSFALYSFHGNLK